MRRSRYFVFDLMIRVCEVLHRKNQSVQKTPFSHVFLAHRQVVTSCDHSCTLSVLRHDEHFGRVSLHTDMFRIMVFFCKNNKKMTKIDII